MSTSTWNKGETPLSLGQPNPGRRKAWWLGERGRQMSESSPTHTHSVDTEKASERTHTTWQL